VLVVMTMNDIYGWIVYDCLFFWKGGMGLGEGVS